jgi:hypothetical protein
MLSIDSVFPIKLDLRLKNTFSSKAMPGEGNSIRNWANAGGVE